MKENVRSASATFGSVRKPTAVVVKNALAGRASSAATTGLVGPLAQREAHGCSSTSHPPAASTRRRCETTTARDWALIPGNAWIHVTSTGICVPATLIERSGTGGPV